MSVETDNKNFVTSVLSWAGAEAPDFSKYTYGLWAVVFENVNNGLGAYSTPSPLLEDIASANFLITGKKYSILDFDGKRPEAKFLITKGVKGINGYDFLEPVAEITNSFVSGSKPIITMPDMDFPGKIYRRTEVTGNQLSFITKNNILAVSGEDWAQTSISVFSNNTDSEYSYVDAGYTGYSNEVTTRYKFLYNDSANSEPQDVSFFEIPFQIENNSLIKYRIARKSDPLGSFEFPDYSADGKVIIDYSQYKDEVSGVIDGSLNYDLQAPIPFSLSQSNLEDIFKNNKSVYIKIADEAVTGFCATKEIVNGYEYLKISLLATGDTENVYRVNGELEKYKLNSKAGINGYVMSEYKMSASDPTKIISLAVNDLVYPRITESGAVYKLSDVEDLVDVLEIIESEKYAQDLDSQEVAAEEDEEETFKVLTAGLNSYSQQLKEALQEDDGEYEGPKETVQEIIEERYQQDIKDTADLLNQNNQTVSYKVTLPNFPLPKKTYSQDYFSNYLNTGEQYVLTPLSNYTNIPIFAFYGDQYGTLAYYINEDPSRKQVTNQPFYRTVVNSTCKGIYINDSSFCKGDTAIYDNRRYSSDGVNFENGLVTQIPSSNGIIKKENYITLDGWKNAINYFYTKNYVSSFSVFPSFTSQDYSNLFIEAFNKVESIIQGPSPKSSSNDSFYKKGGIVPRIFIEREIYTEKYNENQIQEFNRSFSDPANIPDDADLSEEEVDKLYCVQTYDVGNFVKENQQFFYPVQSYDETLEFKEFFPESSVEDANYAGTTVYSYLIDEGSDFGNILFQDKNPNYKKIFRAEYVVGSAAIFSYTNFSSSQAWQGSNGGSIYIANQNLELYSYHLYGYNNNDDQLRLKKSNVSNGDIANVAPYSSAVVIRFTKLEYANATYDYQIVDSDGNAKTYSALSASIVDNNLNLVSSSLVKINIQTYDYSIVSNGIVSNWWMFDENPINNNIYGERDTLGYIQPRFFQDESEDNKLILSNLFVLPNGPYTSKNYEGTPATISDKNGLADGLFNNNIYIKEQPGAATTNKYSYESNCLIDFDDNGSFIKQKTPQSISNKQNIVDFNATRRLRITKIKYNFYVKDLILIGDAGFPYSVNYNEGWEYKLQYREKNSANEWSTLDEDSEFSKDKISVQSSQISPYYYSASDLSVPNFLSMIAFKTNLPLFLDDNNYEFRIAKYEKLMVSTQNVDVIKKTNFLPIKVDWTADAECDYYNIYQKDRAGNLTLIKTQNENLPTSYAIPDVKQIYINEGVFNFGGLNGINYYDMVVSGIVPSTSVSQSALSTQYNGIEIGDSNSQISINKLNSSNTQYTAKSIANTTYSFLIDFNNPETKNSNFTISPNYNGYYFIADGATLVDFDNVTTPFESYIANLNAASCNVNGASVAANSVAIIQGPGTPSTIALSAVPASTFDLSDAQSESVIYLKNNIIVTDDTPLATTIKFKAINDSASTITVQYQSSSITIGANETAFLTFDASTVTKNSTVISNIAVQDDSIYYPDKGLVNIDHSDVYLNPSNTFTDLPIYNASNEPLVINDSISLNRNSFNYVNWNGSTATNTEKSYFDDIKIYLVGGDNADGDGIFYLKDDTEIILDDYAQNTSDVGGEYYFIKDETVNRNLNIKITNGSSTFIVPRGNQDFKLSVDKAKNGIISYKILYPSDNPFFDIDDSLEQLVLLSNDLVQYINLAYLEAKIPKNAFVYFVNKNSNPVYFYRGNVSKRENTLSQNQIARACIVTSGSAKSIKIDILNNAYSHFEFDIKPSEHLTSAINILNLDFCGTQINLPPVSNFNDKELFLISKNRIIPNKINPKEVSSTVSLIQDSNNPNTDDVDEKGQISDRSISLRLYKKDVSDKLPTLERTSFLEFRADNSNSLIIENDVTINEDKIENFYINDAGNNLTNFVLRDYYSRKNSYKGKIFTQKESPFSVSSFDDKHNFSFESTDSLSFDYSPDNFANGRLEVSNNFNAAIYNRISENGSTQINFNFFIDVGQIVANFSYDSVVVQNLSNKRLNKNRIVKRLGSNIVYPIYNKKEFFISTVVSDEWFHVDGDVSYFIINAVDADIDSIIIPDSSVRELIIKNNSGRTYSIQTMSYDGSTYSTTISPEEQIKLSYSLSWSKSSNSLPMPNSALIVKSSNQQYELDSTHPLSSLWAAGFEIDIIQNSIIGDSLEIGQDTYSYLDYTSGWSASNGNIIYCFGRRKIVTDISINNYLVNAFYVYIYYKPNKDEDGFIIKYMQSYSDGGEFIQEISDLNVIEEKHIDLSKYFNNYNAISSLPNNILIPIASQLTYYYLPNLGNKIQNPETNEEKTLGDWIQNKKIIFVNLCKSNGSAPNRIVNYSTTTSIYNSFSTLSFTAGVSSWTTSTGTKPEVKTVYATIRNIKNTTSISTSEIYDGSEFVYLNNFSNFIVDSTSFVNGELGDFYLFNSALNNIFVKKGTTVSQLQGYRFSKISVRQSVSNVYSNDLGINGSASFVVSQIEYDKLPANLEDTINTTYPGLKFGTFVKALISIRQDKYTYLFKYGENRMAKAIEIKDEDFASLDLEKILSALPNHRLFIYGSSQINEDGNSFDSYNLKLLNSETLGSSKFYIQNNTPQGVSIYFKESDTLSAGQIYLPPKRMVEISSNSARFMEHHQKGKFYIGRDKNNINYIQKLNFPLFLDNLVGYKNLNSNAEKISSSDLNVFVSFLSDYFSYCYYSYYKDDILLDNSYSENRKLAIITDVSSMSLIRNVDIVKPNIKITSAGHYVFNNNDNDLKVTIGGSDIFLINNCAKDIYVRKTNASNNNNIILFRNTVLITKTSSDRYLKKAKRRDEFYCVLNPKTTISTQREITLQLGIARNNDVFPILDLENNPQQSYVKLLSKSGSYNTIYFNLSDYYNGKDIPTDSPQNIVAYELGIGHETFYKFLFFNPYNLAYTIPGIKAGQTYQVSIDDGLFRDLKSLPDANGSSDSRDILNPAIIYEGIEYYDGQTFVGARSSNYEVRYPNYVKLSRVVYNIDKTFEPEPKEQEEIDENLSLEEKPLDEAGLFNQIIKEKTPALFSSVISWIPQSEEAFWLRSDFSKDIWLIESVDPSSVITIAYPDGSSNRYVKFTKCTLKKEDLKSVIYNYSFDLWSALQERTMIADQRDLLIGLDADLEDKQIKKIKNYLAQDENKQDFLLNSKEMVIGYIYRDNLLAEDKDNPEILKTSSCQIKFELSKLNKLPSIKFEDLSKDETVKFLNGQ